MPYYFVRSMAPLCRSKKICHTAEDMVDRIKEIQKRTQEFRDKLWEEELIENEISRQVSMDELEKNVMITHVPDRNWKKKFKIFREMDYQVPFERKQCYILIQNNFDEVDNEAKAKN